MRIALFGFASLLLAGFPGHTLLADNCTNEDFKGVYGIVANGAVTLPGFPITGPFARAGQFLPDGKGNVTANTTASYNGFLFFNEPIKGTYSVARDCTVTFNTFVPAPINQAAVFTGVLSNNGRDLTFMISSPLGQVIRAVLKKQDVPGDDSDGGGCSVRDLSKPYVVFLQGNVIIAAPGQVVGEFVRVGTFNPDGTGHFSAQTTANYGGLVIEPENFTGIYTVARDCTVSIEYTFSNVAYTWSGSLIENGKGVDLLVSGPAGSAIGGTLQQQ